MEELFQEKLTELIDKIKELPAEQRGDLEELAEEDVGVVVVDVCPFHQIATFRPSNGSVSI